MDNLRFKTVRFNSNFAGDKENNKPSFDDSYSGNSKQEKIKNLILNSIDYEIDNKFKKIMSMVLIINYVFIKLMNVI